MTEKTKRIMKGHVIGRGQMMWTATDDETIDHAMNDMTM